MAATVDYRASRRYAGALFQLARDRGELQNVAAGLNAVTQVTTESPELMAILHHPRVTEEKKKQVLAQVFAGQVSSDVEHLLLMMVEKDRASLIPGVASQFNRLMDEYLKETDAEAVSAIALTPEQEAALVARLQEATGYKVRLTTRVDENILGGLVVRVGDKLIDASVASQFRGIKERFKQAKVV